MTGRRIIARIFLIIFAIATVTHLAGGAILAAETPQFRMEIDGLNLVKGVSANLVLTVTNAKGAEVTGISGLEDFDVISGSTSTSTTIVNGSTTYEEKAIYVIIPKKTGKFIIRGNVEYDGKAYQTNELQLYISEADNTSNGKAQDLFIKTLLSNNEAYVGQKIVLAYELYSRYNIENFGFLDNTGIKDCISTNVPEDKLKSEITYVDGKKYAKFEARQSFITPIKAGTYSIPAYNFQANVSTEGFFSSSKPVYLQTDAKELTVKPLPSENRPADFSGIIGKLKLEAEYSAREVEYGGSLTLRVTASGNCSLDSLKEILKGDLSDFTIYQTEKNFDEGIENNQYQAKKEFEVILVPKVNGDVRIDPIYISYFNPESGSYEKAEIPGATIAVKGEAEKAQTGEGNEMPSIETVRIDQVSYKPQNEGYLTIQMKKDYLYTGLALFAALLILAASAYFIIKHMGKRDKKLQDIYKQLIKAEDQNEIYSLFNSMIKHCFSLSLKASSRETIANRIADSRLVEPILEIMDFMENKKYCSNIADICLKTKIKEIYKRLK